MAAASGRAASCAAAPFGGMSGIIRTAGRGQAGVYPLPRRQKLKPISFFLLKSVTYHAGSCPSYHALTRVPGADFWVEAAISLQCAP